MSLSELARYLSANQVGKGVTFARGKQGDTAPFSTLRSDGMPIAIFVGDGGQELMIIECDDEFAAKQGVQLTYRMFEHAFEDGKLKHKPSALDLQDNCFAWGKFGIVSNPVTGRRVRELLGVK